MHNKIFDLIFYCILTISFRIYCAIKVQQQQTRETAQMKQEMYEKYIINIPSPKETGAHARKKGERERSFRKRHHFSIYIHRVFTKRAPINDRNVHRFE